MTVNLGIDDYWIENKLIQVMDAAATVDGVAAFSVGFYPFPPRQWYPLVEIFIDGETQIGAGTGGRFLNEYTGVIQVSVRVPDRPQVENRVVVVDSYVQVKQLIMAIRKVLIDTDLATLEDLTRPDSLETVYMFEVADERSVEFGIESRDQRQDSFNNFGVLPFRVETREER